MTKLVHDDAGNRGCRLGLGFRLGLGLGLGLGLDDQTSTR